MIDNRFNILVSVTANDWHTACCPVRERTVTLTEEMGTAKRHTMKHATQRLALNVIAPSQASRYLDDGQRAANMYKDERETQRNSTSLQTNLVSTRKASAPVDMHAIPTWLTDDLVMPAQFFQPADRGRKMRGEVALLYAVLDDAVSCLRKGYFSKGRFAQRLAADAELWFFTDDDGSFFSFVNICAVLGLDPAYLRSGLQQWRLAQRPYRQKKSRRTQVTHTPKLTV